MVTFDYSKYLQSHWHDGQPITIADAVYSIAQGFDLAYDPDKAAIETAMAATSRPYLDTFKGFRLTDDDQLEVYVDYWHFDDEPDRGIRQPHVAEHALGDPGGHGRPGLRPATGGLQRYRRGALRRALAEPGHDPGRQAGRPHACASSAAGTPCPRACSRWAAGRWSPRTRPMPDTRRPRTGSTSTATWSSATARSSSPATTHRPSSRSWTPSGTRPIRSRRPTSTSARRRRCPSTRSMARRRLSARRRRSTVTVQGPGALALRYLLLDPSTGTVVQKGEATPGATPGTFTVTLGADVTDEPLPGPLPAGPVRLE